jgi:hypothetical protein
MLRKVLPVVVILFVSAAYAQPLIIPPSSPYPGSIFQSQQFVVGSLTASGISTVLTVTHGDDASSSQSLYINNDQSVPANYSPLGIDLLGWWFQDEIKTKGNQQQVADFEQQAEAESDCGIITVSAFISGWGDQAQFVGYADDPKAQAQILGLASDQLLLSTGNAEGATYNGDYMAGEQLGKNGASSMAESSLVDAAQYADIDGKPNTTVSAVNSIIAATAQAQQVY